MSRSVGKLPDLRVRFRDRLRLPLIAAPMFRVSGPELVIAACRSGVVGSFPTKNCRDIQELDRWLATIKSCLQPNDAPFAVNLIMRGASLRDEVETIVRHRVELVVTSVGSPEPVIGQLHDADCSVLADVASLRHVQRAIAVGVDGLVLLSAGAGGQTGWANGLAFARSVRRFYDGPLALAGGIQDGAALLAACAAGCDFGYMGTRFIATEESMAEEAYKDMLVVSSLDDVVLSDAFTGLNANMLASSIRSAGLDPTALPKCAGVGVADGTYGAGGASNAKRWRDIWSAGHTVSGVRRVLDVAGLVGEVHNEFMAAQRQLMERLTPTVERDVMGGRP